MEKYEYKFIEIQIPKWGRGKDKKTGYERCKAAIKSEAKDGWRLKQVLTPFNERAGVYMPKNYTIIFERKISK